MHKKYTAVYLSEVSTNRRFRLFIKILKTTGFCPFKAINASALGLLRCECIITEYDQGELTKVKLMVPTVGCCEAK